MVNKFILIIHGSNEECSWSIPYAFETISSKDDIELKIYNELDKVCEYLNKSDFDKIPKVLIIENEIIDNYRDLIYEINNKFTYENIHVQTLDEYFHSLLTKNNI